MLTPINVTLLYFVVSSVSDLMMSRLSKEDKGDVDLDLFTASRDMFTASEKVSLCMQHTDR